MSYEDQTEVNEEMLDDQQEVEEELPEGIEEEDESEETGEEELESLDEGDDQDQQPAEEQPPASEPGWIKQRVNKAVAKAVAETERRMRSEFEAQMAPIRDKMLTDEAKELVRQGEFKSLDRAKEYLQLKQGINPAKQESQPEPQPRNTNGQFAQKTDPVVSARIDMLAHQADTIKAKTGKDVMSVFESDAEIKSKVISGEMDFYDVAETMKAPKKRPPAPMRSPNGASGKATSFADMSKEQFARLEKRIEEGGRFKLN